MKNGAQNCSNSEIINRTLHGCSIPYSGAFHTLLLVFCTLLLLFRTLHAARQMDPDTAAMLSLAASENPELCILFVVIVILHRLARPPLALPPRTDFHAIDPFLFRTLFRFDACDLEQLGELLGLPLRVVVPDNGVTCTRFEAMTILCGRLAYPTRWDPLAWQFGIKPGSLRTIFYHVLFFVWVRWGRLVHKVDMQRIGPYLPRFAAAVQDRGAALERCWGFIDGTARDICRPSLGQREVFNGHKRFHCLAFQGVTTPDGIIAQFYGPEPGCHHDQYVLARSGLVDELGGYMAANHPAGEHYYLYGDKGYAISDMIMTPFKGAQITGDEDAFNKSMATVRESVEWSFGKLVTIWAYLDYRKKLKLRQAPLGVVFGVCALLTNLHTCYYGSEVSHFFGVAPPSPSQYLNGEPDARDFMVDTDDDSDVPV